MLCRGNTPLSPGTCTRRTDYSATGHMLSQKFIVVGVHSLNLPVSVLARVRTSGRLGQEMMFGVSRHAHMVAWSCKDNLEHMCHLYEIGNTQGCEVPGTIWLMALNGGQSGFGEVQMPMNLARSTRMRFSGPAETPLLQRALMHMLMCSFLACTSPSHSCDRGKHFTHLSHLDNHR